ACGNGRPAKCRTTPGSSSWGSSPSWSCSSASASSSDSSRGDDVVGILSFLWIIPFVGSLIVWGIGTTQRAAKWIALGFSLVELGLASWLLLALINGSWAGALGTPTASQPPTPGPFVPLYYMERVGWWTQFGFNYVVGVDGLSVPLIWLTALLTTLAVVFHWDEEARPRAFFGLFLFLEMALVGVFLALDFIIFAFLHGALRHATGSSIVYMTLGAQIPIFAAFLFGFIVKLPSVPFHTWLPDAHVEAPTGGSVLLAGVLLKMGGYGIFRINLGMLPDAARNLWWALAILGTASMIYAAFVCLAQVDLKRLIAYSSVGHMGFVLLGAGSLTVIGVQGAIFQLFNHGIITAILFMLAGSVKHSTGTRDIPRLQGLARVMPQFSLILAIGFFASLGLPGLNSFWSEFMVFVGAYGSPNLDMNRRLVLIPLISIVVTAAYYLYTMQRILFGDPPEDLAKAHDLLPWER